MECMCLPGGVGENQFSELELGGAGTKELCAGGSSAGHEARCEKFWLDLSEWLRKKEESPCLCKGKKKASILVLIFIFMIKINNFKLLVFDVPLGRNPNNFNDADVIHRSTISMNHCSFFLTKRRN